MRSAEGVPCPPLFDLPAEVVSERYERMRIGGDGELTRIAYAVLRVDDPLSARLFAELPPVVRADSWDDDDAGSFQTVLRLLAREAMADRPGGETVMTRLADVLVIQVVRRWLRSRTVPESGWIAGLSDPHLGRALARIHTEPGAILTLVELAREARLSRSAFAERFARVVGEPPMRYLAGWRLDAARGELVRGDESIATISDRVGYASEAAFSRAFKRRHGLTPGDVRRAARGGSVSVRSSSVGG
jgi:AraC-like DNA-binding protein